MLSLRLTQATAPCSCAAVPRPLSGGGKKGLGVGDSGLGREWRRSLSCLPPQAYRLKPSPAGRCHIGSRRATAAELETGVTRSRETRTVAVQSHPVVSLLPQGWSTFSFVRNREQPNPS